MVLSGDRHDTELTIQIHMGGRWYDAARIQFLEPHRGISGATRLAYEIDYWAEHAAVDAIEDDVLDRRALSVRVPVDLNHHVLDRWPSFLLDLLPQGSSRQIIARDLGLRRDDPSLETHLLQRASSTPVGNIRIREAWQREQEALRSLNCRHLTDEDLLSASAAFCDVLTLCDRAALGASCLQGEWPKYLFTRSRQDCAWYPEPCVATDDGIEHVIVKLTKSSRETDKMILASEAPYLELARAFGINCGRPLRYKAGALIIPRFDRAERSGRVLLHGQESLSSALGVTEFGARRWHEDYLRVIDQVSDDPVADRLEYLKRDVLNIAAGNPDNHGRNTAIQRHAGGGIRLAPLFDFAPMAMSDAGIVRNSRWRCLGGADPDGDWTEVCAAVACVGLSTDDVRSALLGMIPQLRGLRDLAGELGVPSEVISRAIRPERVIAAIEKLHGA